MNDFQEGLYFEGAVPLGIKKVAALPESLQLARINHGNEVVLRASLMLDEGHEHDENSEVGQALARQETKLNLVLDLLGELVRNQTGVPPEQFIQLTPQTLAFAATPEQQDAFHSGDTVRLSLYLTPELPRQVELYGLVEAAGDTISVAIRNQSQHVNDYLEKIIFRYHRRKVALRKATEETS